MHRSKSLVIVSHCILNQNSVVCPLARAKGAFNFVKTLVESGVGIIQLPCPEFRYLGITRKPMNKQEYDNPEYRVLCRNLFKPILEDITAYVESGYEIKGIIGIKESPTCSISGNRGIFMEEIFKLLTENNMYLPYTDVPEYYSEEDLGIAETIRKRLKI